MAFTTVFILLPFGLFASSILCYLLLSKHQVFRNVRPTAIRIVIKILLHFIIIIIFTYVLIIIGMVLLMGIVGLPVLILLDIFLIIFLIKRKNSKFENMSFELNGIEEIKNSIISSMEEYLTINQNVGYTLKDVNQLKEILELYLIKTRRIKNTNHNQFNMLIEEIVIELNEMNSKCHYSLIETDQREMICSYMIKIAMYFHFIEEYSDITETWREW